MNGCNKATLELVRLWRYHLALAQGAASHRSIPSEEPAAQTPATNRLKQDKAAQALLGDAARLSIVAAADYDPAFYPGGHGPVWDLAEDRDPIRLIEAMHAAGRTVAAVCHGAAFRYTKARDGSPLVNGRSVTGFSNSD
jgi:putative intracellular protease/amidase